MSQLGRARVVLCDLDGVVWLAHEPIAGSVDAVARLESAGVHVLFVTNNSFSTVTEQERRLGTIGIDARGRVITAAMSAATVVAPRSRVLLVGGDGLHEELSRAGARVVVSHEDGADDGAVDAVVVGMHRQFSYDILARASSAVRAGALLVGSNDDATYPTPDGELPGGGSILAAVEKASGRAAVVTGKPHRPMADLVLASCPGVPPDEMIMVGDRPETDGAFARRLGCRFALVASGVAHADPGEHGVRRADLAAVVDELLA